MLVIRFIIYFLIYGENKDIFERNAHVIQFYAEAPFFAFEIAALNAILSGTLEELARSLPD